MNNLLKVFMLASLIPVSMCCQAQTERALKPDLFNAFSQKIVTPVSELSKAFTAKEGTTVLLQIGNGFPFSGIVYSSIKKYNNLSSVIIKSPGFHNATLCISRRINDDKTITYVGRIINEQYADGYELKKDDTGNYSFYKIRTADLIQDY